MWIKKKPDRPQAANPEPTNLQTNRPLEPAPGQLERNSRDAIRPAGENTDRAMSRLGSSLHVKGGICGNEDLVIEGSVEGSVQLDQRRLTVGTAAKVTADIVAGDVVVYGKVKGNVRAKGSIEIKKDGLVEGDLTTPQIMIEDGAYFKGSIEIEKSAEKQVDKSVLPPAA